MCMCLRMSVYGMNPFGESFLQSETQGGLDISLSTVGSFRIVSLVLGFLLD